jgi:hypothetical protein
VERAAHNKLMRERESLVRWSVRGDRERHIGEGASGEKEMEREREACDGMREGESGIDRQVG